MNVTDSGVHGAIIKVRRRLRSGQLNPEFLIGSKHHIHTMSLYDVVAGRLLNYLIAAVRIVRTQVKNLQSTVFADAG
ncbi:MAG: hypothetical protein ABSE43_10830 [Steroidobacteraceae bacterium]